jgi:hypothetical protein
MSMMSVKEAKKGSAKFISNENDNNYKTFDNSQNPSLRNSRNRGLNASAFIESVLNQNHQRG